MRFFCGLAEHRKLAFVSDDGAQKTASASAECRFASVSMMARGGREKASQRLNPESRSKNRKSLIIKDFRFSLLHFWRVFGEIGLQ